MTSGEEIIHIINAVRYSRQDGVLYVMATRIAWMPASQDMFSVNHHYSSIKTQKISPANKEQVKLQLVLHNGTAETFHFVNSDGRESQLSDRETVKLELMKLLPKFREKANSVLEEKNRLLRENKGLFQLYKDLVVGQVISAEKFWSNISKDKYDLNSHTQSTGVSASFLADIVRTDGCNGIQYNLTADTIESIFKTYPCVKQKHMETVPKEMSEQKFWEQFFQSHYYHRDRVLMQNKSDIFTEHPEQLEERLVVDAKSPNDGIDVLSLTDDTLPEGYGSTESQSSSQSSSSSTDNSQQSQRKSNSRANSMLIRRFNVHSTRVLEAGLESSSNLDPSTWMLRQQSKISSNDSNSSESQTSSSSVSSSQASSSSASTSSSGRKRKKSGDLDEIYSFDDMSFSSLKNTGVSLNLKSSESYLRGPTLDRNKIGREIHNNETGCKIIDKTIIQSWRPDLSKCLDEKSASIVLSQFSQAVNSKKDESRSQQLHEALQKDINTITQSLAELLRHYWACYPANTPQLESKLENMMEALLKFKASKLGPLESQLAQQEVQQVTRLNAMISSAIDKYETWKKKRKVLRMR